MSLNIVLIQFSASWDVDENIKILSCLIETAVNQVKADKNYSPLSPIYVFTPESSDFPEPPTQTNRLQHFYFEHNHPLLTALCQLANQLSIFLLIGSLYIRPLVDPGLFLDEEQKEKDYKTNETHKQKQKENEQENQSSEKEKEKELVSGLGYRSFQRSYLISPNGKVTRRYNRIHLIKNPLHSNINEQNFLIPGYSPSTALIECLNPEEMNKDNGNEANDSKGEVNSNSSPLKPFTLAQNQEVYMGLSIGHDIRFPNMFNHLALNHKVSIFSAPYKLPESKLLQSQQMTLVRSRAIESNSFFVCPSSADNDSFLIDPNGEILIHLPAKSNSSKGHYCSKLIDLNQVDEVRNSFPWSWGPASSAPSSSQTKGGELNKSLPQLALPKLNNNSIKFSNKLQYYYHNVDEDLNQNANDDNQTIPSDSITSK